MSDLSGVYGLDSFEKELYCRGSGLSDNVEIIFSGKKLLPTHLLPKHRPFLQYMMQYKEVILIRGYRNVISTLNMGCAKYTINKSIALFDENHLSGLLISFNVNDISNICDDRFMKHFYFNAIHLL